MMPLLLTQDNMHIFNFPFPQKKEVEVPNLSLGAKQNNNNKKTQLFSAESCLQKQLTSPSLAAIIPAGAKESSHFQQVPC